MRSINHLLSLHWAITEEHMQSLQALANKALSGELSEKWNGYGKVKIPKKLTIRDGVAILPIKGTLYRYESTLSRLCEGISSYEGLAKLLNQALTSPEVHSIVLDIDSPGGEANGCMSFAELVRKACQVKPVTAYIEGTGASAAYWIAAATRRIVASKASEVGSIGVVCSAYKSTKANSVVFVSSVSLNKHPDMDSDEGRQLIQERIDDLGKLFVECIAEYRGITPKAVLSSYGQGKVFIAEKALARGLIDEISTIDQVIENLRKEHGVQVEEKLSASYLKEHHPEAVTALYDEFAMQLKAEHEAITQEAASKERERIQGILSLSGPQVLMEACLNDPSKDKKDAALMIVEWINSRESLAKGVDRSISSPYLEAFTSQDMELKVSADIAANEENELSKEVDELRKLGVLR